MRKRKYIWLAIGLTALVALILWTAWSNTALELNTYTISSDRVPENFHGFRIALVSDLHNAQMGENNEHLLEMLRNADPDMIAITGDLIDSRNTDTAVALRFVQAAVRIAPCYYVTGNHEARTNAYATLKTGMEAAGVVILDDTQEKILVEGQEILVLGVNDPSFSANYLSGEEETILHEKLKEALADADGFTVLLSHRPEFFDLYAQYDVDLVLSGHAHGGQFRLPFIGGLAAPNQGLFPEFDAGLYTQGNTNMLVSRGIGNSLFPFRFNDRPEVILITLRSAA